MNKMERRYSFSPIDNAKYRAQISSDSNSRHIKGYGIVFNQQSKIITEWVQDKQEVRSFYEIIAPTALDGILNNGFDVVMDVNHEFDELLARIASKTLTLSKDNIGVMYEFDAPNTSRGEDALQMVIRGDYFESSFAFVVAVDGDIWELDKNTGLYTRTITKIETLYDMAICTYRGAYCNTNIEVSANPTMDSSYGMMEEKAFEYAKEDIEVASRKLNELLTSKSIVVEPVKPSTKYNEDFITRIYLKRNWERKQ